ncbi:hypothetical protein TNIN_258931 [Trichonephila inaurata madagascariensis]|uniref:Uncharacterized protein n=1 Tax=Trichonephila inaurata madagascariensis TaxID=2747483 RepID=A0A8X6YFU9_9ARAC|nr:hypothetical protein TNIN_258931 [Trichonephila inaurata madagascariensis]
MSFEGISLTAYMYTYFIFGRDIFINAGVLELYRVVRFKNPIMSRHDKRVTICSAKEKGWDDDDRRCLCGDQRGKAPWGRIVTDICPSVSGGYTCRREELLR